MSCRPPLAAKQRHDFALAYLKVDTVQHVAFVVPSPSRSFRLFLQHIGQRSVMAAPM